MSRYKQFAVLGLGRFGQSIARTLSDNGMEVLACDLDLDLVQEISQYDTHAVQVDVKDENALNALGLGNFDVVVVAIGVDVESSVMATLIAKQNGAKYVVAKAQNQIQKRILEKIGADKVVLPEWEMGAKIAASLISSNVVDFIELSEEHSIIEIEPKREWYGLSLQKSNIRALTGLNVIAIKRDKKVLVSPKAEEVIRDNDILVVIGETRSLQMFYMSATDSGGSY